MEFIYVLELANGKYYVGRTRNIRKRFQAHVTGRGAAWTKIHRPSKLRQVAVMVSIFDEQKITLRYMMKYGIDNVRGGIFCSAKLPAADVAIIRRMINSATNKCYICGQSGHFASACGE
jgi:predicted GIY-YIG superfamily endonuclease